MTKKQPPSKLFPQGIKNISGFEYILLFLAVFGSLKKTLKMPIAYN